MPAIAEAVHSLQSGLSSKNREIWPHFADSAASVGGNSLAFRLSRGEGGIRTLGTGVSPYNGLAIHRRVLNRYENLLLYSSFQRVTRRSI